MTSVADRNANILESLKQLVSKFIINIHVELRKVSHTKQRLGLLRSLNSADDRILLSKENVERQGFQRIISSRMILLHKLK